MINKNKLVTLKQAKMLHDSTKPVLLSVTKSESIEEFSVDAIVVNSVCYVQGFCKVQPTYSDEEAPLKIQFCTAKEVYLPVGPFVLTFMPLQPNSSGPSTCFYIFEVTGYHYGAKPETYFKHRRTKSLMPTYRYFVQGFVPVRRQPRNH